MPAARVYYLLALTTLLGMVGIVVPAALPVFQHKAVIALTA